MNNLTDTSQPIFKSVFGNSWETLPEVMHKHYANRPYCNDVVIVEGKMDVTFGWLASVLNPILRMLGTLVPYRGKDIPVTVYFRSEAESNAFCFDREFHFPDKPVYNFRSRLVPQDGNEVIEYMRFGIGWRCSYIYDCNKVILLHKGYVWKLLGIRIPVPIGILLGKGYAVEEAISDNRFRMIMTISHPIWGRVYEYSGEFEVMK